MKESANSRLALLRSKMKEAGISAVIVPQADPHMSEYLSRHWQCRRWLSGFTGSAGDLIVTLDKALLWTDSRYFLQAARQLAPTEIKLMKDGLPDTPSIAEWLADSLKAGEVVGIDGMNFSCRAKDDLEMRLNARGIVLRADYDPIDGVWTDRPALPADKVFIHELKYAGEKASDKISAALKAATGEGATAIFTSALDEIAWLLNLRSNDVRYNPVLTSFLYLSPSQNVLFIDGAKLDDTVHAYLKAEGVATAPYSAVKDFLKNLPEGEVVLIDEARTAAGICDLLGAKARRGGSLIAMPKAIKNEVQLAGLRRAMHRDGVAMVKSLFEIKSKVAAGEAITELDVAEILRRYRSAGELFFDESFGTIAGYGPHGAIVHYEADEETNATLTPSSLLLIDSGAQYLDGTTDITRTIALSDTPTELEKRDFTLVLKGHIALARAVFPAGTCGTQLDVLAHQYLWSEGLNYLHGTGHGVGHFLNVHEGPQSIRTNHMPAKITPGMVTSNEPGLYREGVHGIRCENLILAVPAMTTDFGSFLRFETLTLCPFDLSLLDTAIMSNQEIEWLNDYHARVYAELSPSLDGPTLAWLRQSTQAIPLHK